MAEDIKVVPKGWRRVRLGDVLDYEQPQRYIVKSEKYDDRHGTPVLTPGKAFILGFTDETTGIFEEVPVIIFDDFTTESRYVIFPFKVKSSALKVLKLKDRNSNLYFLYNIMQILNFKPGSEHKRFWISEYSKINILIPPLPEQRKIAEILETVDNAIEKTDAIIEKYKRIKQGLMQDLLTRGIAESDELGVMSYELRDEKKHRFKDSPLGRIPEEWEVVELGEVVESFAGGTPNRENKEFFSGSIKWLKSGEINRKYIYDTEEKITMKGFKFSSTKWIERNTVVIALYGATAGQVGIVKDKMTMNQAVLALNTFKNKLNYEYIYYYLSAYVPKILSQLQGSGQPNLSKKIIDTIQIPLPPLPEQKRIASILSQIDEVIEKEQKYKEKLERIKKGLMEDLLTGKVRVLGVMNYELGVKS